MRTTAILTSLLIACALSCGCASHHMLVTPVGSITKVGLINDPQKVNDLEKAMSDKGISQLLELDVRAKLPTMLAVAKLTGSSGCNPSIVQMSAEELKNWEGIIPDKKLITGVQYISDLMVEKPYGPSDTLKALRVAAAKMRCELLLVYVQGDSSVNNYNDLAGLYWTFVGLWLAPGNELEHWTIMQAIILDSRTGAILGTGVGDTHLKQAVPAAFSAITRDKLDQEAPKKTLAQLQEGCKGVLSAIVKRAVGEKAANEKAE